ncbi:effector-associated domain EAD1-containing protein [Dactylosporangium sp. NPDC006015]|uniref:effector-associated domain EAD1-containing protein n=1 Tax=Dactylosporangium sp. NPDC006015 TaxID=3154576 RepID=UPI0033BB6906
MSMCRPVGGIWHTQRCRTVTVAPASRSKVVPHLQSVDRPARPAAGPRRVLRRCGIERPQVLQFAAAMRDAYTSWSQVEMVVYYAGHDLAAIVGDVGLDAVVFRLLRQAKAEGWLDALVDAVIEDRAGNALVKRFAEQHGRSAEVASSLAVPPNVRVLDSTYFDLEAIRKTVVHRVVRQPPGLHAISLASREDILVSKFSTWLQHLLGEAEHVGTLTLQPEFAQPDLRVKQVLQQLPDPDDGGRIWSVRVDHAPLAVVRDFWQGVRDNCPQLDQWFVLILTGAPGPLCLDGVIDLAEPVFGNEDVSAWVSDALMEMRWDRQLLAPWSRYVEQEATVAGVLDVLLTYGALDKSIGALRKDPHPQRFRHWLEKVS